MVGTGWLLAISRLLPVLQGAAEIVWEAAAKKGLISKSTKEACQTTKIRGLDCYDPCFWTYQLPQLTHRGCFYFFIWIHANLQGPTIKSYLCNFQLLVDKKEVQITDFVSANKTITSFWSPTWNSPYKNLPNSLDVEPAALAKDSFAHYSVVECFTNKISTQPFSKLVLGKLLQATEATVAGAQPERWTPLLWMRLPHFQVSQQGANAPKNRREIPTENSVTSKLQDCVQLIATP